MAVKIISIIGAVLLLARSGSGQTSVLGNTDSTVPSGYSPKPMYPSFRFTDIPVMDMYSPHLACRSVDMYDKTVKPFSVVAGSMVPLTFDSVDISPITKAAIKGPCTFYLSDTKTKGKGAVWFPIEKESFGGGLWCSENIKKNGYKHGVVIPKEVPPGTYYLRTEIIDLNSSIGEEDFTKGPHFYVNCMAITVTGSGKASPKGYKIPGIYNNAESKFKVDAGGAAESAKFVIPGPVMDASLAFKL
ncbi:hypothetical protein IWW39_000906 [Coemansia spiralis]|uniref:lytic cellulose monooxygenase (C4-dehydrogenating) n=1 Tax=Coemansia spiralis TaxID=417178 RepID=A0A9W8GNF5_9FUNG|nr:hypothetical protein IWW39_000906 [Coemansia spiralis]